MEDSIVCKKAEIRKIYLKKRSSISIDEKTESDQIITENIVNMQEFQTCQTLLIYVSTEDEVNTRDIIHIALDKGKKVAVPRTYPSELVMEFYEIRSLDDLKPGRYGILEPNPISEKRVSDMANALCLVPGLCFDDCGNRLGYGGGYYDRFLQNFSGVAAGLCRSIQLYEGRLPCEANDIPVRLIVTEHGRYEL